MGVISGTARSTAGAAVSDVTIQALNAGGSVVGTTVTSREGSFTLPSVPFGTYTVQCVNSRNEVIGTASVTLAAVSATVGVTCATEVAAPPPAPRNRRLLFALAAAAAGAAIGAVAVVAGGGDASGAR
jgi:hypothetical protein